jgi:mannose-6-phosphate isomerase-like protein (cupin superfamily)
MTPFTTLRVEDALSVRAPDGSEVRILPALQGGSMARFELAAGQVSLAVTHRSVEEIWFVVGGRGQMWRCQAARKETVELEPGVCVTIPVGTQFQFRAAADAPLTAVAITMPPWPGAEEAVVVEGAWAATRHPRGGGDPGL